MMTGLTVVLGTSLLLFVGSLVYAIVQDWVSGNRLFKKIVAEHVAQSGLHPMQMSFNRTARRPSRVLGSFIL